MYVFLNSLSAKLLGFEYVKELYANVSNFVDVFATSDKGSFDKFYKHDGYLLMENKFCVPNSSMHELLVKKAHNGGLVGHFGVKKILESLYEHFYWPKMKKDVICICNRCIDVERPSLKLYQMVCIHLYQFLASLGYIFVWISFWGCLGLEREEIPFL